METAPEYLIHGEARDTEERIVRAATKVFMQKGFDGARMQEIADEAQINKALLHYYFRSKEQLFSKIFRELTKDTHMALQRALESDGHFVDKIRQLVRDEMQQLLQNPTLPMFVIREISRDAERFRSLVADTPLRQSFVQFSAHVHEAVRRNEIRPIDPIQLLLHILALVRFPFLAKPMVMTVTGYSESEYQQALEERTNEVVHILVNSLKVDQ